MNTKPTTEATPQQIAEFYKFKTEITSERLAYLNHAKLQFSESADKLSEAQKNYNNSLIFTYNDFSRLPENLKSLTNNDEKIMEHMLNNMLLSDVEEDVEFLKTNIDKLTKAIIFLRAHTFELSLNLEERAELNEHMKIISDYRINLMSSFFKETTLENEKGKEMPCIMKSSIDDLLIILYEFLQKIDNWEQTAGELNLEEFSEELTESYNYLEKNIVEIQRNKTEVPASKRNELRIFCKHISKIVTEKLGGENE